MCAAPANAQEFDRAYRAPLTMWGDWRIPAEVKAMAAAPARVLELGCGIGRNARYLTAQGMVVTGVDFSPVAIERARARVAGDRRQPEFVVDDVQELSRVTGPFDRSLDIGCFHCLSASGQVRYAAALARLLRPRRSATMAGK